MSGLASILAFDREELMVAALAALVVAGAVVAIGAWLLFLRHAPRGTTTLRSQDQDAETDLALAAGVTPPEDVPEP